ncbi:LOW QUALITY PROTEIN: hypothetical protein HID58_018751 [Brassica napus]|uniref:Uncharacterized protein n=1 Tax=Brassica napus TaxID=3708 RepID=A0ABQ8DAS2_BRANA|nr:LOW QUALITY PROTEIN: hypothetical protein HID58_018751 [Brassica napus]
MLTYCESRSRAEHDYSDRRHERLVERPLRRPGDNCLSDSGSGHSQRYVPYQTMKPQIWKEKISRVGCSSSNTSTDLEVMDLGLMKPPTRTEIYHYIWLESLLVMKMLLEFYTCFDFSPVEKETRATDFPHIHNNDLNKGQIIEALPDMGIGGSGVGAQLHDASMDMIDDQDEDLLGEELKEMEEPHHTASSSNAMAKGSKARSSNKGP